MCLHHRVNIRSSKARKYLEHCLVTGGFSSLLMVITKSRGFIECFCQWAGGRNLSESGFFIDVYLDNSH